MGTNNLTIFVDDLSAVMASYDVIRVRRAVTDAGPWLELTAATAQKATLLGTLTGPFASLSGKIMQFLLNSLPQINLTFTGTNPLNINQVVSQVNAVAPGIAFEEGGKLRLRSTVTGTASKLEMVGGAALADLGFTVGQRDIGEEAYVPLVVGHTTYPFYDRDGGDYVYEAAFYNTLNYLMSAWSEPFRAEPGTVLDASRLSTGSIDLVNASGVSVADQRITFFPLFEPLEVDDYEVALMRDPITITTNNAGHAEVALVRGLKVKVVFEGTSYVREITVPDTATFNILDLMSVAPDPFNPIVPDYPYAIRRTI